MIRRRARSRDMRWVSPLWMSSKTWQVVARTTRRECGTWRRSRLSLSSRSREIYRLQSSGTARTPSFKPVKIYTCVCMIFETSQSLKQQCRQGRTSHRHLICEMIRSVLACEALIQKVVMCSSGHWKIYSVPCTLIQSMKRHLLQDLSAKSPWLYPLVTTRSLTC